MCHFTITIGGLRLSGGINLNLIKIRYIFGFGLLLLLAGAIPAVGAQGDSRPGQPDVRMVIDISGSMKQNDPDNLRQPAVELLLQLLPAGSRAGIWTFGSQVNMLVPHRPVTEQWRREARQLSGGIQSIALHTNIGMALERAAYDFALPDSGYRTSIILLTDGMVDIDKDTETNRRERQRIIEEVLPRISRAGYRIHTIALSDNADRDLMDQLSLASGGIAATAHSADELMRIFLRAFDASAPSEQVALQNKRFVIDASVKEFTALIFHDGKRESTALIGPDGKTWRSSSAGDGINWYSATEYDLVTVMQPIAGEWQVDTPQNSLDPDSRVTVISDLNLRVKTLPNNIVTDESREVMFQLEEKGEAIARTEFLSLLSINARIESANDDNHESIWTREIPAVPVPLEGRYQFDLPPFNSNGLYRLVLHIDGKSFTRQFSHQFNVRQNPDVTDRQAVSVVELPAQEQADSTQKQADSAREQAVEIPVTTIEEDKSQPPLPEPPKISKPVDVSPPPGAPRWLVFGLLGVLNLAIFAGGYYGYCYIMGGLKKNGTRKEPTQEPEPEPRHDKKVEVNDPKVNQQTTSEEEGDEEPPMDDLDSAINELNLLSEYSREADTGNSEPEDGLDDLDMMSIDEKNQRKTTSDSKD